MATSFEKLSFTKDWNNASDFPTYEENEAQVRADMQALHDETKKFINEKLIPNIENLAVPGAGDMRADVYDPTGVMQDVFAYARAQAAAALSAARTNTESAVSEYDTAQTEKFDGVNVRLAAAENALKTTPGAITLLREYRTAGEYTAELPTSTAAVYAIVVGAGGGGGTSGTATTTGSNVADCYGGGGGAGGNCLFVGPILPENITNFKVVVGAGGESDCDGGMSSAFGVSVRGGARGASGEASNYTSGYGTQPGEGGAGVSDGFGDMAGGSGGKGGMSRGTVGGTYTGQSSSGIATKAVIPTTLLTFSAGGGGGGSSDGVAASAGGVCGFGRGGAGGAFGQNGADGGQCCGGGGAGYSYLGGTGGKGGDGYVAIWVQRNGINA